MAITYHFDLYPRTNPSGALLVRFTNLQSAEYRGEANGTGAGSFSIRATDAEAAFIDPDGLQYVRVVRDDGATELVVGGFFLESGEYGALTSDETKLVTYRGAGTLSYLGRGVMDADSWINDPFIGTDPQPDGTWPLHLAGTGNELGAILWRVLHELEEPGRHQDPVPLMTLGFTHLVDSNAVSWVQETGDFVAQVSDTVLSIIRRLMQLGLYVEVDPDDFEVRAYEPGTHRRDRTGVAWAADVVRFQSPTDGTIATGNIKSDAKRALEAKVRRNALLVGSNDTWEWVPDAGVTVPWEGGYILDDEDGGSLADAGAAQLAARSEAGDVLRLRMKLGDDEANGAYLPFEHVLLDDLVTVHTGTGQWDYDEAEFPVAALTVSLRPGGDWDAWADLGSTYSSLAQREFDSQPVGHHTHPPNPKICRDPPGSPLSYPIELLGRFRFDRVISATPASIQLGMREDDGIGASGTNSWFVGAHVGDLNDVAGEPNFESLYLDITADSASGFWSGIAKVLVVTSIADDEFNLRVYAEDDVIRARAWRVGDAEPGIWQIEAVPGTGTAIPIAANKYLELGLDPGDGVAAEVTNLAFVTGYSTTPDAFTRTVASGLGLSPITAQNWFISGGDAADVSVDGTTAIATDAINALLRTPASSTCIHGGPGANSGEAGTCSATVSACNHDHDYVAPGGTAGQVLKKASGADWDTEWGDESGGLHAASHSNGGADEVSVENLGTAETDTTMVLSPNGTGGVEFRAEAGGGGIAGELVTDTIIGDGAEDTFTLSETPTGTWALVSTNGADLLPTEYTISGDDIIFDVAPANLSEVLVTFITGGFVGGAAVDPLDIADPTMATAQEVAEKLNELMANMRTAGILV